MSRDCNNRVSMEDFPDEILLSIFSFLDIKSLSNMARTSSRMKNLCYESSFYTTLDLRSFRGKLNDHLLHSFLNRSNGVRRLEIFLGSYISSPGFVEFLMGSSYKITFLNLSSCFFLDTDCITAIAQFCPLLETLVLRNCKSFGGDGIDFSDISRLRKLKFLDLSESYVPTQTIFQISRNCCQMEHLFLRNCVRGDREVLLGPVVRWSIFDAEDFAKVLEDNVRNLKNLDVSYSYSLSELYVDAFKNKCADLRKVSMEICNELQVHTVDPILDFACRHLKKLLVTGHDQRNVYVEIIISRE